MIHPVAGAGSMACSVVATNGSPVFLANMGVVDEHFCWLTLTELNTSHCGMTNIESVSPCAEM